MPLCTCAQAAVCMLHSGACFADVKCLTRRIQLRTVCVSCRRAYCQRPAVRLTSVGSGAVA
eukprot:6261047-Alexandrium_andersonii.AAC.1